MRQGRLRYLALGLWLLAVGGVAIFSLLPQLAPPADHHFDKILHFGVYFSLAGWAAITLKRVAPVLIAALFLTLIGVAVEVAQGFVLGRMGSSADALANASGVAAAICIKLIAGRFSRAFWRPPE